jgi:hypothetical protein
VPAATTSSTFAEALVEHAQTEEEVMYPAAMLVGQVVRQRLGLRAVAADLRMAP